MARNAFPSSVSSVTSSLFRIADLSHVWIIADLVGDEQAAIPPAPPPRHAGGTAGHRARATVSEALCASTVRRARQLALDADNPRSYPPAGDVRGPRVLDQPSRSGHRARRSDRRDRVEEKPCTSSAATECIEPRRVETGVAIRRSRPDRQRTRSCGFDRRVGKRAARFSESYAERGPRRA